MKFIDADATRAALPFDRLVPALRTMFINGCEVPPRQVHDIGGATSLVMPAWQPGRYYGLKVVNVAAGNAARGLPGLHSIYLLFDATTGAPLAQIDGDEITARRTAAASALAGSMLARRDAQRLLVVGAGRVAGLLPSAYRSVLDIRTVQVWARNAAKAQALVETLHRSGIAARAVGGSVPDVGAADIVSCATLATEPLVQGQALVPGSHLDLIGSFTPQMREADDACFADGAGLYIDTAEALRKSGDLLGPLGRGVFAEAQVRGTLADLCRGNTGGRRNAEERTVFKSVGSALEDLAAAILAYESGSA